MAETTAQSKPVSTPKKSAKSAVRRKLAQSGEGVSVAELDTASRKPSTVAGDAVHLVAGPQTRSTGSN